jgi:hypothetical protein
MIVGTALVLHPEYEDGLLGRIALSALSVVALTRIPDTVDSMLLNTPLTHISTQGFVVWTALALFLARHWYRFYIARKGHYLAGMRDRRRIGGGGGPAVIQK